MISDSNFSIYHIHYLEKILDEKELKSWDSDINNILPGMFNNIFLTIVNLNKYY